MVVIVGTNIETGFVVDHMEIRQVTTVGKEIDIDEYYEKMKVLKPAIEMLIELSGDKVRKR